MKKILYSTTAFVLCGIAQSQAACITTPSCTTLGYTSTTSCTDGLKCPFGNYWNCTHINKITELTNKITELEKIIETSQSQGDDCVIGSILYSDKTCSVTPQSGKTPIGVVVYVDGNGGGQAMALELMGYYAWSTEEVDISSLPNYDRVEDAFWDLDSCNNTAKIIASGNKSKYPAAWAAHEYKTEVTSAGDWCLPAAGILSLIYHHQHEVNMGIAYVNGREVRDSDYSWSSSEYDDGVAWSSSFKSRYGISHGGKYRNLTIRPVIEF